MHWTGPKKLVVGAMTLVFAFTLSMPSVGIAEELAAEYVNSGEPTDPEDISALLTEAGYDPDDYGFDAGGSGDERQADTWLQSLIDILRNLGLLPEASGS